MQIIRGEKYLEKLQSIMEFIAKDSITSALEFQLNLDEQISDLHDMPFKYRKSIYFDDKSIRDLVFKGYAVPYKIDKTKKTITIIGINKYQLELY